MIFETIDLYESFKIPRGKNGGGQLRIYARSPFPEIDEKIRPAMLVVPGGGYSFVSEREGEPVALDFLSAGYTAFVLNYTVDTAYPVPLVEAAMAMAFIRKNAAKYGVDTDHVAAVGFSAGGHLVGMLATHYEDACVKEALKGDASLVRPDAVILSYAVLTTGKKTSHGGTSKVISGGDKALREFLSLEKCVKPTAPPAFLWHTYEDELVPVDNTLLMAQAYLDAGVPFEVHIFEHGHHGLSLADVEVTKDKTTSGYLPAVQVWTTLARNWLGSRGFEVKAK